ncbi:MAG: aldehyde dehydrogenase family protein [Steroidobacteraceae bacterium]
MSSDAAQAIAALERKYFQREYGHFINGEWVQGASGKTLQVLSPSTGAVQAQIQAGNAQDVDRAVRAAHAAFKSWSRTSAHQRQAALLEMARRLRARVADFAMMETLDNGKTIVESTYFDIPATIEMLEFFAGAAFLVKGETVDHPDAITYVHREPLGVIAAITPWNIQLFAMVLKLGPALAAGNTLVLKPAESTCLAVLEFAREMASVLPPGVFNIVTGLGPEAGEPLVTHPLVRKVAFTGSRATARKVIGYASANIIPQTMELGGKSANIICEDADLEAAVEGAVLSTVFNKGEVCIAGTRAFVHEKVYDEFLEKFTRTLKRVRIGNPTDPATQLGPQASKIQLDRVCAYLDLGPQEGAKVVLGGKRASVAGLEGGYFVEPTIFANVNNGMRIAQEEIFGPVTCVIPWKTEEEVISLSNESIYGLGGGLWTANLGRAHRIARELQTGTVWINRYYNFVPGLPLGGYKQSGFGREGALESLNHYTISKSVVVNLKEGALGVFAETPPG